MSDYVMYYRTNFEEALEYQDWVCDQLRKTTPALIIGPYSSKKYQNKKGESFSGIEIKHDKRLAGNDNDVKPTHNLYFEIAEKAHPSNPNFVDSGIYRKDNGWLFLIGNYEEIFLFCTKQLCTLWEYQKWHKQYKVTERHLLTSTGFTIPRSIVLKSMFLLNHWVFDEEAIKKHHPGEQVY